MILRKGKPCISGVHLIHWPPLHHWRSCAVSGSLGPASVMDACLVWPWYEETWQECDAVRYHQEIQHGHVPEHAPVPAAIPSLSPSPGYPSWCVCQCLVWMQDASHWSPATQAMTNIRENGTTGWNLNFLKKHRFVFYIISSDALDPCVA